MNTAVHEHCVDGRSRNAIGARVGWQWLLGQQKNEPGNMVLVIALIGVLAAIPALLSKSLLVLFIAAVLSGCSELNGLCGMAHLGTLTPIRHAAPVSLWLRVVAAYTVGGTVSASALGLFLGWLGEVIDATGAFLLAIPALSIILVSREVGWIRFALPQVRRQTQRMWVYQYGIPIAAAMWGFHIGAAVVTVIRHGGFFVLCLAALMLGPAKGTAIMVAYWLGRTLPIWLAGLLSLGSSDGRELTESVQRHDGPFRYVAVAALVCFIAWALSVQWSLHI